MLQDLREYLEENPDNAVAPEWSETVRNSVRIKDTIILHDFSVKFSFRLHFYSEFWYLVFVFARRIHLLGSKWAKK